MGVSPIELTVGRGYSNKRKPSAKGEKKNGGIFNCPSVPINSNVGV